MEITRYALWVEYDGSLFRGFQRLTPRSSGKPRRSGNPRLWPRQSTLQEELEVKLSLLLRQEIKVYGAGRTDRGVHATCQVVAFDTSTTQSPEDFVRSLNAVLATGLTVTRWKAVEADFHPRFSAIQRVYHYYLWPEAPPASAFWGGLCWLLPYALDTESMRRAAAPLLGCHDFSAYTRSPEAGETRLRRLQHVEIHPHLLAPQLVRGPFAQLRPWICVEVRANAFLRRMVRQLVANLVEVGRGNWSENRPAEILRSLDPDQSAPPAPAHGLFLVHVEYEKSAAAPQDHDG